MPSRDTLRRFIAKVESNAPIEAIEAPFAALASMQENELPPPMGRDALMNCRRSFPPAQTKTSQRHSAL